ncbi:MAG: DAK2 domain-containing protein [Chloroflexi bacterium]|nr:DAK2 domain-containing protein [Chloroflexota bacterium]
MQNRSSSRGIDLASLFNVAAQALAANQTSLNQADTDNQNHGDNMVQAFNMITQALGSQQGASPSQQLSHASQYLSQHATSGSAHAYSQGLAQAAQQLQGQDAVTPDNAMMLIQSLLGGGQQPASQGGGDLLGSLLGGGQQSAAPDAGDLLGALLGGGQSPQQSTSQAQDGLDLGDLLNAGMAFMSAKQQGQGNLQAGLAALMAAGPLGQKPHRQQSGQLVANALLQAVAGMSRK